MQVSSGYLFRLVGIGEWSDHPDDIKVSERSAGGEGTGQDCCLAPSHFHTPRVHEHFQGAHQTCKEGEKAVSHSSVSPMPVVWSGLPIPRARQVVALPGGRARQSHESKV